MKITNDNFLKERQYIKDTMKYYDSKGNYVSAFPLKKPFFIKVDSNYYQMLGITSSFVNNKYVEMFITINVGITMQFFDERAVNIYYFDDNSIKRAVEVDETDAKNGYKRAEWRRFQKYVKKEKNNIVKNENKKE